MLDDDVLYKTTNKGDKWDSIALSQYQINNLEYKGDTVISSSVYPSRTLYFTTDGGNNWSFKTCDIPDYVSKILFLPQFLIGSSSLFFSPEN